MKSLTLLPVAILCAFFLNSTVYANTLTYSGSIYTPTEIDFIDFSLSADKTITIDILAYEEKDSGETVTLFGQTAGDDLLDTEVLLFTSAGDFIAGSEETADADFLEASQDGSVSIFDSFLKTDLTAGGYRITIGAYPIWLDNESEALVGLNNAISHENAPEDITLGRYKITITSEGNSLHPVPEPSTFILFGAGIIGLITSKSRHKLQRTSSSMKL